jgi:hypothetical protein
MLGVGAETKEKAAAEGGDSRLGISTWSPPTKGSLSRCFNGIVMDDTTARMARLDDVWPPISEDDNNNNNNNNNDNRLQYTHHNHQEVITNV